MQVGKGVVQLIVLVLVKGEMWIQFRFRFRFIGFLLIRYVLRTRADTTSDQRQVMMYDVHHHTWHGIIVI